MKVLLFTRVPESPGRVSVKNEMESRGHQIDFVSPSIVGTSQLELSSLVETIKRYDIFHCATGLGEVILEKVHNLLGGTSVVSINDRTKVISSPGSKLSQAISFIENNVSTPKTYRSDQPVYSEIVEVLGETFIAKKPYGTKGKAVWLIKNEADLASITDGSELIFQEYIESEGDYRIHVVGGDTPFCAYRRLNPKDDFRSNIYQGGQAAKIADQNEEMEVGKLAAKAAKAVGLDYCGVDIIRSNKDGRFYVLEINMDPGFHHVEQITGKFFASVIVDYYEKAANKK